MTFSESRTRSAIFLLLLLFLASCGARRQPVTSNTRAALAADAMARIDNKELYRFINHWTGVRYRLGGLDKSGVDCSGFAYLLQKQIYGKELPRRSRDQAGVINRKSPSHLKEGDLVFFSFGGKDVDHVGVYLNNGFFVHASTTRGVVVDDLNLPAYQNAFTGGGPVNR
ncbi:hydrolase [Pedobacter yulinensis]|uniref:Hydrolase n=1 Tax=Pedobacter yulinensis TaxID=2126353 RepID=A0A2T3HLF3_9SPHI|nr:C40 family peptidase [Pedobacter yulinensis]PST83221.1 hydrolase [Pedobacter yulinensis]